MGLLILTGENTYTGGTVINSGTVQLGNGGTSGSIRGDVSFNGNGTVLAFDRSDNLSFGGVISGRGFVNQIGTGTTTLTAANTYTGMTTISAGALALTGDGSIAASAGVQDDGVFDISGTTAGAVGRGAVRKRGARARLANAHDHW